MKSLIIMLGLLTLLWGGFHTNGGDNESAKESLQMAEQPQSIDQLSGTWYGFPAGLLLHINKNGTTQFGQDSAGKLIGYRAEMELRGRQLHIQFIDYTGPEELCQTAIGRYVLQIYESGAVRFEPVQDDCHFRLEILRGPADSGMLYHRFDND